MGKLACRLTFAAALVAVLHASLIVHAIHPLFHSQSLCSQILAAPQSAGACCQACCQPHRGAATSGPSVGPVGAECPVCKFLLHFQSRDGLSGDCGVSPDATHEVCAPMGSPVYIAAIHSPANARAPPALFPSVTAA
jgi:hypothetical protein